MCIAAQQHEQLPEVGC